MVIHKVKTEKFKWYQQYMMVTDCVYYWLILKNVNSQYFTDIMNMKTYRYNYEHDYYVATSFHLNLNKW